MTIYTMLRVNSFVLSFKLLTIFDFKVSLSRQVTISVLYLNQ